jgi:hypothetical protein
MTVLLGAANPELEQALMKAGFQSKLISFTRFDAQAAAKVNHFETYNRTPASQRVADIVAAVGAQPGAVVIADGDAALASILAAAIVPIRLAILDVKSFDSSNDQAFVDHLYIPGLRRAGDLATAASMARGEIVVHDAGPAFSVTAAASAGCEIVGDRDRRALRKSQSTADDEHGEITMAFSLKRPAIHGACTLLVSALSLAVHAQEHQHAGDLAQSRSSRSLSKFAGLKPRSRTWGSRCRRRIERQ